MADQSPCPACANENAVIRECPGCGLAPRLVWVERLSRWVKVGGGATIAMTLMACYGLPPGERDRMHDAKTEQAHPTPTDETLGGLKLAMPEADVVKLIGEPSTKDASTSTSTWSDRGLTITFDETKRIRRLDLTAPGKLATSRGITIGTPQADAQAAASDGVTFEYEAGIVAKIVIAAE